MCNEWLTGHHADVAVLGARCHGDVANGLVDAEAARRGQPHVGLACEHQCTDARTLASAPSVLIRETAVETIGSLEYTRVALAPVVTMATHALASVNGNGLFGPLKEPGRRTRIR